VENEFNIHEAAEEIIAAGEPQADSTEHSDSEGQSATNPETTEEVKELSPEEILNQLDKEQAPPIDPKLVEMINGFGLSRKGIPFTVESPDQVKEFIQKGFDYTEKTMAHAEEVRVQTEKFSAMETQFTERETQFAQREQEFQGQMQINNVINGLVDKWESADPELYAYIIEAAKNELSEQTKVHPMVQKYESKFDELNKRFESLEKGNQGKELGAIKETWEKDLSDVQTKYASQLKKLGVSPDWEKVKSAWMADSTNKMTVEQALYAAHGADIQKANESHKKLLEVKNKVATKNLGRNGVSNSQRGGKEEVKAIKPGDYNSILRQHLEQI
jgi:hypothetical protein